MSQLAASVVNRSAPTGPGARETVEPISAALHRVTDTLAADVHLTSAWPEVDVSKAIDKELAIIGKAPQAERLTRIVREQTEGHDQLRSALVTPAGQRTRSQDALVEIATRVAAEARHPALPNDPDGASLALRDVYRLSEEAISTSDAPYPTKQAIDLLLRKWGTLDPAIDGLLNGGPVADTSRLEGNRFQRVVDDAMTLRGDLVGMTARRFTALQTQGAQVSDSYEES